MLLYFTFAFHKALNISYSNNNSLVQIIKEAQTISYNSGLIRSVLEALTEETIFWKGRFLTPPPCPRHLETKSLKGLQLDHRGLRAVFDAEGEEQLWI